MSSRDKFRRWQKRLQPGRTGLLIDGDWGFPLETYSKGEAKKRGLKAWNHRWVAKPDLPLLKSQYLAYSRIRTIATLIACIGLFVLLQAVGTIAEAPPGIRGGIGAGSALLYPVLHFAVAWGIARYKNSARWVATVLYPLLIPPQTFNIHQQSEIAACRMVVLGFFIYMMVGFFSKTARTIFTAASMTRSGAASTTVVAQRTGSKGVSDQEAALD